MTPLSLESLSAFGILPEDEGMHPHPADMEAWQESVFHDWIDASGQRAGHCRIGLHPAQGRLWIWLFLYDGEGWVGLEQPRLDLGRFDRDAWSFDQRGLAFERQIHTPLRSSTLCKILHQRAGDATLGPA